MGRWSHGGGKVFNVFTSANQQLVTLSGRNEMMVFLRLLTGDEYQAIICVQEVQHERVTVTLIGQKPPEKGCEGLIFFKPTSLSVTTSKISLTEWLVEKP